MYVCLCKFDIAPFTEYAISKKTELVQMLSDRYSDYDKQGRPVFKSADVVNVSIGLTLVSILDYNEADEVITLSVWNRMVSMYS